MGLACKNAILIVEFARELEFHGNGIVEAAQEACRLRLRPIVMTSVALRQTRAKGMGKARPCDG
jgi:multidrug efflux pump